jgi:hypothetical protein
MATLSVLKTRLDVHVNRTDTDYTANKTEFVNAGLRWLQRKLLKGAGTDARWQNSVDLVAGVTAIGVPEVSSQGAYRPSSKTRLYRIDGTSRVELRRIPLEWLQAPYWDQELGELVELGDVGTRGVPRYFAIRGRALEIRPVADKTYTLELFGLAYYKDLSSDGDENLLTIEAEDACLYAALRACWIFFEDAGKADFWEERARVAALEWMGDRIDELSGEAPLVMATPG